MYFTHFSILYLTLEQSALIFVGGFFELPNQLSTTHPDGINHGFVPVHIATRMRARNLPEGQSALQFTRNQLDRLEIGQEVTHIPWGTRCFTLPPSHLAG